jgi:ribosomal RNA methyltransferase Nop2
MGQGRRIKKKQGAPEPLSEEHYTNLKRKTGLSVNDPPAKAPSIKKRRISTKPEPPKSNNKAKGAAQTKQTNGSKAKLNRDSKKAGKPKPKLPLPELEADEDVGNEFGASDLDDKVDEFPGLDGNELDATKLGDDFIGSEDESMFDSDRELERKQEQFTFSDDKDESDSDSEMKLTAANIESLSRKLDKKSEEDRAAAEAELRESALQTNIDGDRPKVLGDEEDGDDNLDVKGKSLLAPDLQLLRQRITDTIRVLGNFAKLGESGRSRAEYTARLLRDICSVRISFSCSKYALEARKPGIHLLLGYSLPKFLPPSRAKKKS